MLFALWVGRFGFSVCHCHVTTLLLLWMTSGKINPKSTICHSEGTKWPWESSGAKCGCRLDCHVATFVASRNDKRKNKSQIYHTSFRGNEVTVGIQRSENAASPWFLRRNDVAPLNDTRKNHRRGNGNTQILRIADSLAWSIALLTAQSFICYKFEQGKEHNLQFRMNDCLVDACFARRWWSWIFRRRAGHAHINQIIWRNCGGRFYPCLNW